MKNVFFKLQSQKQKQTGDDKSINKSIRKVMTKINNKPVKQVNDKDYKGFKGFEIEFEK